MSRAIVTLFGLALAYAAALWWLVTGAPARANAPSLFPSGSSYSRSEQGAALAATYLRGRGHVVQPLLTSSLAGVAPRSVIFVISPPPFPEGAANARPLFTVDEERFIRTEGQTGLHAPHFRWRVQRNPTPTTRACGGQRSPQGQARHTGSEAESHHDQAVKSNSGSSKSGGTSKSDTPAKKPTPPPAAEKKEDTPPAKKPEAAKPAEPEKKSAESMPKKGDGEFGHDDDDKQTAETKPAAAPEPKPEPNNPLPSSQSAGWKVVKVNGRDYITAESIHQFYRFSSSIVC